MFRNYPKKIHENGKNWEKNGQEQEKETEKVNSVLNQK